MHEGWKDNLFLQTAFDKGMAEIATTAPVVVRREYRTARQVMNPLEGKAVLAHWEERTGQLVVHTSTQVPHMIRTAIAEHLGIAQGRVRVIAPDVGGGFGYKCVLQPEELCVAWLALKFRQPFRWIEDRREHLIPAPIAANITTSSPPMRMSAARLLGVDADITVDAGAYSVWPFTSCLEARWPVGTCPVLTSSRPIGPAPSASPPTSRRSCPIAVSRAPASVSRWS